jgi:hypothetical protein
MAAKKTKSGAIVTSRNQSGEMTRIEGHRFSDGPWQFSATIPSALPEELSEFRLLSNTRASRCGRRRGANRREISA